MRETRPFTLLVALVTLAVIVWDGALLEPPAFLQTDPEVIAGSFTRCGPGRGYYCVIDGDTFKMGQRKVRVLGIDTPEVDANARPKPPPPSAPRRRCRPGSTAAPSA